MYQPPAFREDRRDVHHALIRAHPLGLLITAGPAGLTANFIPFMADADAAGAAWGTLRAHLARGNSQLAELAAVDECLVVFQGPQEYVSPSWYATKRETGKVVPTWNYVTVQARGRPRVLDDAAWVRQQIGDMTRSREQSRAQPWAVEDAPDEFVASQVKGIVGVEINVMRAEGKWKVSQNRHEADRRGVIAGLSDQGAGSQSMANLVAERGALRPSR